MTRSLSSLLVVTGSCVLWFGVLIAGGAAAPLVPVLLVGGIAGSVVIWYAAHGKRWALVTLYIVGTFWVASSFRARQRGEVGVDWQVAIKFVFWCSFLAIGVLNIKRLVRFLGDPVMLCLAVYMLLAALSVVYSEAPMMTTAYVMVVISYLMFACVCADYFSFRDAMVMTTWMLFIHMICDLLSAVVVPDLAWPQAFGPDITEEDIDRLQGVAGAPNSLGVLAQFFIIFLIGSIYHGFLRRRVWIPMAFIGVLVVYMTHDRTAVIALALGAIVQLPRRFLWPTLTYIGFTAVSILLSGETTAILGLIGRSGDAAEAETMSGRTEVWQFVADLIAARPWLGYGFDTFEAYAGTVWKGDSWAPIISPHNNYLLLLYSGGILGALPWLTAMVILLYRWLRHPSLLRDMMTFNMLLHGYSEADLPSIQATTFFFFLVLAFDAKRWITTQYDRRAE